MDTLLELGQHAPSISGIPIPITGHQQLLQQAMIRLTVPLGSFPYDSGLGSRLTTLKNKRDASRGELWAAVQEALRPLPELQLNKLEFSFPQPDCLELSLSFQIEQTHYSLEVMI